MVKKNPKRDLLEFIKELQQLGVGEIVINSIDNDGVMKGYDLSLIRTVNQVLSIPLTVLGGAGSLDDIAAVIKQEQIIGVAAGSQFVF